MAYIADPHASFSSLILDHARALGKLSAESQAEADRSMVRLVDARLDGFLEQLSTKVAKRARSAFYASYESNLRALMPADVEG